MECSKCGVSSVKTRLFEMISSKGIINLCSACSKEEDMPVLRRPTTFQLKDAEKEQGFYRKASVEISKRPEKDKEQERAEMSLKKLVDKKYKETISKELKPRPDLVDNFHWIIMRARRMKKLTQKQLAQEIVEAEAAINMAEQGILPEDDYRLVNKLESFLNIKIRKTDVPIIPKKEPARVVKFDKEIMEKLTIADLKEMKEEGEIEILEVDEKSEEEIKEESEG